MNCHNCKQPTEREIQEIRLMRQLKELKTENSRLWNIYYEKCHGFPEFEAWTKSNREVEKIEEQIKELNKE